MTIPAQGEEFDIMLRFTKDSMHVEVFMDETVKAIIDGILAENDQLVVKINWFADRLTIITPIKKQ